MYKLTITVDIDDRYVVTPVDEGDSPLLAAAPLTLLRGAVSEFTAGPCHGHAWYDLERQPDPIEPGCLVVGAGLTLAHRVVAVVGAHAWVKAHDGATGALVPVAELRRVR